MTHVGVILAGGRGTRLGSLTKNMPKPLLKINQREFIDYIIYYISSYNFKKIYLVCSYKHKEFFLRYHKKKIFDCLIICLQEDKPRGTGGALYTIKKRIKSNFFLFNGDSLFLVDLNKFYNFAKKNDQNLISIALASNKNYLSNTKLSNIKLKKNKIIFSKNKSSIMNGGIYYIKKKFINLISKNELSLENDIIPKLVSKNLVNGKYFKNYFIDIGLKKNLQLAKKNLNKIKLHKCAFLDRDGVINYDYGYVCSRKRLKIMPGVLKTIKLLNKKKYLVTVVTNQSGVGRGYFTEKNVNNLHKFIKVELLKKGSIIDDFIYCPHHPKAKITKYKKKCSCRKPNIGMIKQIAKKWQVNIEKSFMIGDKETDMRCAIKSNLKFAYRSENFFSQIKNFS